MSVPEIGLTSFTPTKANVQKYEQQKKVFNFMTQGLKKTENEKPLTKEEYLALSAKAHKEQEAADAKKAKELYQKNNPEMVKAGKIATETGKVLLAAGTLGASALIGCNSVNQDFTVEANQKMKIDVKPTTIITPPDTVYVEVEKPIYIPGDTVYIPGKEIEVPTFPDYNPPVNKDLVEMIEGLTGKDLDEGVLVNSRGVASWEKNAIVDSDLKIFNSSDGSMVFGCEYMYRGKDGKYDPNNKSYGRMQFSQNQDGTMTLLLEDAVPLKNKPMDESQISQYRKLVLSQEDAKKYLAQLLGADGQRAEHLELTPDKTEEGSITIKNLNTGAESWFSNTSFTTAKIKKGESPSQNPEW